MSERFQLLPYEPIITVAMRAAREDEMLQALPAQPACLYPGCLKTPFLHRRNTQYIDDASNWLCVCEEHAKMDDDEMQDRWDELHADIRAGIAAGMCRY